MKSLGIKTYLPGGQGAASHIHRLVRIDEAPYRYRCVDCGARLYARWRCERCDYRHNPDELCAGWKCPKCGSRDLAVTVKKWAVLHQDAYDDFWTATGEIDGNSDDWDGESLMRCLRCKCTAKADEFETKPSE